MAGVPQSILEVKRPEDTAVFNTNSGTNFSYIVRRKATAEELAVKPSARYKEVVGHIIDGVFVPVETREYLLKKALDITGGIIHERILLFMNMFTQGLWYSMIPK